VKSDATPEEIRAVVDDPTAGVQIFRNALAQSDRYGQARQAYKEAQDRHVEIQRLEATITQLGQLFNEVIAH
jgi:syntaxin 1B/2/3